MYIPLWLIYELYRPRCAWWDYEAYVCLRRGLIEPRGSTTLQPPPLSSKIRRWRSKYRNVFVNKLNCQRSGQWFFSAFGLFQPTVDLKLCKSCTQKKQSRLVEVLEWMTHWHTVLYRFLIYSELPHPVTTTESIAWTLCSPQKQVKWDVRKWYRLCRTTSWLWITYYRFLVLPICDAIICFPAKCQVKVSSVCFKGHFSLHHKVLRTFWW